MPLGRLRNVGIQYSAYIGLALALFFFLFSPAAVWAGTGEASKSRLQLFDFHGNEIASYDQIINQLPLGTVLRFMDQMEYQIVGKPQEGSTTVVYKVLRYPEGKTPFALRLPIQSGNWLSLPMLISEESTWRVSEFINQTFYAFGELKRSGIRIPKVHNFVSNQYVLVEWIDFDFLLKDLIEDVDLLPLNEVNQAKQALVTFAKSTARYARLQDFRPENIAYIAAKAEWVFLDQVSGNIEIERADLGGERAPTAFDGIRKRAKSVEMLLFFEDLIEEIHLERQRLQNSCRAILASASAPL